MTETPGKKEHDRVEPHPDDDSLTQEILSVGHKGTAAIFQHFKDRHSAFFRDRVTKDESLIGGEIIGRLLRLRRLGRIGEIYPPATTLNDPPETTTPSEPLASDGLEPLEDR